MLFNKHIQYHKLEKEVDDNAQTYDQDDRIREGYWRQAFFILLAGFILITTSFVITLSWSLRVLIHKPDGLGSGVRQPYSPASSFVRYENRWLVGDPKFMGPPRPELDQAWHGLLRGTLIRVSEEELGAANATSIPLEDGGYAAGLGISHSLHCLQRIRKYLHKSYYYPGDQHDWTELEEHASHCVESLRQLLMCQADPALYTLEWTTHSRTKPSMLDPQIHMCTDFDALHRWMIEREAHFDRLAPPPNEFYEGRQYDENSGVVKADTTCAEGAC